MLLDKLLSTDESSPHLSTLHKYYFPNRILFAFPEFAASPASPAGNTAEKPPVMQGAKQSIEGAGEKPDVASLAASMNETSSIGSVVSEPPPIPKIVPISDAVSMMMDPFLNCVLSLKCLFVRCVTDSLPTLHSNPLYAPELQYRSTAVFVSHLLSEFWETPIQRLLVSRRKAGGHSTLPKGSAPKVFFF